MKQFYRGCDGHWYFRILSYLIWRSPGRTPSSDDFQGLLEKYGKTPQIQFEHNDVGGIHTLPTTHP